MPYSNARRARELYVWILDYLPHGHPDDTRPLYQKHPLLQAVGEENFILMELAPKEDTVPQQYDRAYIGDGERDVIDHVKRRLRYDELTHNAQIELPFILKTIVDKNGERFIKVYNESYPITTRLHMLSLLPGIGKKTLREILDERKKGPFKSFEELSERVKTIHNPDKIVANRIEEELQDENCKYRIFTPRTGSP